MNLFEYLKRLILELIDNNKTGAIEHGNQKAVTGGAVYDYHNTTPLNPKANLYIEKSGNVINIEARDVDGSAFTTYPGAGGYTLPTGYRPKRMLIVCVYVYTTYDNKNHHGIIKIRDDGTMDGYFIDFSGNEHKIYDSSYSSSVSFNTSYIV